MEYKKPSKSVKIDERSVQEQLHRKISRIWSKVVQKHSSTGLEVTGYPDDPKKNVRFGDQRCKTDVPPESEESPTEPELSPIAVMRKMARLKTFAKRKSPLQKFDEIVTRELLNRQYADDDNICPFDSSQKWQNQDFGPGKKLSLDKQMSKTRIFSAEKVILEKDKDPADAEDAELMDAIDKLIQAEATFRYDAMVKAAEAASSSVPPELAEEVAISSAKDYQSHIIDIVSEKVTDKDGHKPMEVIGYIGITSANPPGDDE